MGAPDAPRVRPGGPGDDAARSIGAHLRAHIATYGDPLGPTIASHREEKGRSWAEIIDKAATPDGGDIETLMDQMPPMTVENIDAMLDTLDTPEHAQETAHAIAHLEEQRALLTGGAPRAGGP